MGYLVAFALATALAQDVPVLASRPISPTFALIPEEPPTNFDLYDLRHQPPPLPAAEVDRHSIFAIRRHLGVAAGYDNGVLHGSVGLYLTVAEWGRWNFGIPSPEFGFGRYPSYNAQTKSSAPKTQSTVFVSLVSVHYRGGYLQSIGKLWYVNFEQVFDARANLTGSQIGFSFSSP